MYYMRAVAPECAQCLLATRGKMLQYQDIKEKQLWSTAHGKVEICACLFSSEENNCDVSIFLLSSVN